MNHTWVKNLNMRKCSFRVRTCVNSLHLTLSCYIMYTYKMYFVDFANLILGFSTFIFVLLELTTTNSKRKSTK